MLHLRCLHWRLRVVLLVHIYLLRAEKTFKFGSLVFAFQLKELLFKRNTL